MRHCHIFHIVKPRQSCPAGIYNRSPQTWLLPEWSFRLHLYKCKRTYRHFLPNVGVILLQMIIYVKYKRMTFTFGCVRTRCPSGAGPLLPVCPLPRSRNTHPHCQNGLALLWVGSVRVSCVYLHGWPMAYQRTLRALGS